MALAIVAPWLAGIVLGQVSHGMIASFGAYLLGVSFPHVPAAGRGKLLLCSALIISAFAAVGAFVSLGSIIFFVAAVVAAILQCLGELKGGYLRLPVALGVLAFFLSVGQVADGERFFYSLSFLAGTFWAGLIVLVAIPVAQKTPERGAIALAARADQRHFVAGGALVSMLGSVGACFVPGSHPCWLPAAGLRVMKPTRDQTVYRMKARGLGTTLGAAAGGLILGLPAQPVFHAFLVAMLVFLMLKIGAKKYGGWSFCLTAIALTFNLTANGSALEIASNRVLLTICGIAIAAVVLPILSRQVQSGEPQPK